MMASRASSSQVFRNPLRYKSIVSHLYSKDEIGKIWKLNISGIHLHLIHLLFVFYCSIGCAKTGSGKTFAFALPIIQKLHKDPYGIFALVLTPTRELAIQVFDMICSIDKKSILARVLPTDC